jgi:hypothetical protein
MGRVVVFTAVGGLGLPVEGVLIVGALLLGGAYLIGNYAGKKAKRT